MYWNSENQLKKYAQHARLTLTWDVLKLLYEQPRNGWSMININMRCIEMIEVAYQNTVNVD